MYVEKCVYTYMHEHVYAHSVQARLRDSLHARHPHAGHGSADLSELWIAQALLLEYVFEGLFAQDSTHVS